MARATLAQSELGGSDGRFVYLDSEIHAGTVIELSDVHGRKGMGYQPARLLSQSWDGKSPSARPASSSGSSAISSGAPVRAAGTRADPEPYAA